MEEDASPVSKEDVAQVVDAIERQRSLTSGASAAGARVHNLPARPRDIADDGALH